MDSVLSNFFFFFAFISSLYFSTKLQVAFPTHTAPWVSLSCHLLTTSPAIIPTHFQPNRHLQPLNWFHPSIHPTQTTTHRHKLETSLVKAIIRGPLLYFVQQLVVTSIVGRLVWLPCARGGTQHRRHLGVPILLFPIILVSRNRLTMAVLL